ncbi:outer membrane beta-barrel protein [Dyadobacter sp. 676]|uniref:Outer membrane beta-barrel protein n=1 Tax=Dyadobacter sp. 676 TaxID=3088362 RepID=A0AAU8FKY4_9BACT
MKRYYALIILTVIAQGSAFGQLEEGFRRWRAGVMTGPHLTIQVPEIPGVDQTVGIMTAADVGYALQNSHKGWSLHFQPGVNRWKTNQVNGEQGSDYYLEWKWKSATINLPLLVRYTILQGRVRPFAEMGASYLVRNYWKVKGSGQTCQNETCYPNEFDDKGNSSLEKGRFSALAGVGVEFGLGKITIPVTVRWNEQLKKIERFDDAFTGMQYTIPRSRTIQVAIGVTF